MVSTNVAEKNKQFLHMAYGSMGLPLYIVAHDSFEVLYQNEAALSLFGDIRGRKCHEALNATAHVCDQCVPLHELEAKGASSCPLKRYLSAADKHIKTYESIITLPDGTSCRLCQVIDVSEQVLSRAENEARSKARADMQYLMNIHSAFISSAKSMMTAAALDGRLIFVNKTMEQALGYTQDEIMLMHINDFHPEEASRAFREEHLPSAIRLGVWKGDSQLIKKDGSIMPIRMIVFPIRDQEGNIIATAAIMDDITDVLEMERMNRYQIAIMECSSNYIGVSDPEGNTLYHSPGAYRMLGYEPGETEWDMSEPHPEWYLKRLNDEGIPTAMREGQWTGRGEVIDRYGKHIPVEQTIFPIFDDKQRQMGMATIITDITEQVEKEKEIEAGRRMLRTIIDTVPCAIFWKDKDSRFLGANIQFAHDVGRDTPDSIVGLSEYDVCNDATATNYIAVDQSIFVTGKEYLYVEEASVNADGSEHWVSTSKVLLRDEFNEPYALLGVYNDITAIKQNEKKLEQAIKMAEEASRTKGEFLSRMSHEIRTPMNAIKGLAELLALTELESVQQNYVRNIVRSSNSLLSIINDVLDFAKINENKLELVEGIYMLEDLIAEACNVVSLRAAEKGLMLLVDISPDLPKALIGDDVRIKQVIINILNNAVKYTPKGHVILRLSGEQANGGFELVCAVEDSGIGIRPEDIPFLFEAFSQADRRVNHNIQGTGLGLSISDRLIRAMGGSIAVKSDYGKGSIFTARFPQRIENPEPLASVEKPEDMRLLLLLRDVRVGCVSHMLFELGIAYELVKPGEDPVYMASGRYTHCLFDDSFSDKSIRRLRDRMQGCVFIALKDMRYAMGQNELHDTVLFIPLLITELVKALTITPGQGYGMSEKQSAIDDFALTDTLALVVDDNEINLIVSEEILRAYKADVICAQGGQEALDLCETKVFDLIFMDHMMPGMDGVETTIAIRQGNSPNKSTPIIALTANVVNDMASHYIKSGMDDFISKPIEIDQLSRVLLKWLPESKITSMKEALQPEPARAEPVYSREKAMERLISSLDDFGMYVSDVMREIGSDYDVFITRMDKVRNELAPLVERLRAQVCKESWDDFARDIANLGVMIHNIGARDCSGRARKLSTAARERNIAYIKGDFFSLMDNMYMLEKKMEVAVPLALGSIGPEIPFGDMGYCRELLTKMGGALLQADARAAASLLDDLAHYSLDHDLDLLLVGVGAKLAVQDFNAAIKLHKKAVEHCERLE